MGEDFETMHGGGKRRPGQIVLSKTMVIIYVIMTVLVIVAVALLVGFVGRPKSGPVADDQVDNYEVAPTTKAEMVEPTTAAMPPSEPPSGPWSDFRLPKSLDPVHYVVDLQPGLEPVSAGFYLFNGSSVVYFTVNVATKHIVLHSLLLIYTEVSVLDSQGNPLSSTYMLYEPNQFLIITLDQDMTVGQTYTLSTKFYGELGADLGGLYRSSYTNSSGDSVVFVTSHMQPSSARKAFPCFDEPALKATFDVFLWHKDPNFALSNMPNVSTVNMYGDWKRTEFGRTKIMSTYLLAFVVCDFEYVQNFTQDGVQSRIYARPSRIRNGAADYANNISPAILQYFQDFFNVTYALPKSDHIAEPDSSDVAMENWGLIIYREQYLLYNPAISSSSDKQLVATVISHELAHQWFGDLVSPVWWDELWLNEGFANYVSLIGVDNVEPSWRVLDQFVLNDLYKAMSVDGLTSSRPVVSAKVNSLEEIYKLNDQITYNKGSCLFLMIHQFAGNVAFKLGLQNYLKDHAYSAAEHNQLFNSWEAAINATAGVDNPPGGFVDSMNTWILQMGYPVVNMARDGTTNNVRMTQNRFLLDPEANLTMPPSPYSYKWNIPFWYSTQSNLNKRIMWIERTSAVSVPSDEYYIGNYEAFGYYRVNYDLENWNRIIAQLNSNFSVINVKSRAQLMDDAFNLARAKQLSYEIALGLTQFLRNDFDYVPWKSMINVLSYIDVMLGRSKAYGVYLQYMLYLVEPQMNEHLTISGQGEHLQQLQWINIVEFSCWYGNQKCISYARGSFAEWMVSNNNKIPPNFRRTIYCYAIAYGGVNEWEFAWRQYHEETNLQQRAVIKQAFTCARSPWLIRRILDLALNESYGKLQDAGNILNGLCKNNYAREITWDYFRERLNSVPSTNRLEILAFSDVVKSCASQFSTEFELQELQNLAATLPVISGSSKDAFKDIIEEVKANIKWRNENEEVVFKWLTNVAEAAG